MKVHLEGERIKIKSWEKLKGKKPPKGQLPFGEKAKHLCGRSFRITNVNHSGIMRDIPYYSIKQDTGGPFISNWMIDNG